MSTRANPLIPTLDTLFVRTQWAQAQGDDAALERVRELVDRLELTPIYVTLVTARDANLPQSQREVAAAQVAATVAALPAAGPNGELALYGFEITLAAEALAKMAGYGMVLVASVAQRVADILDPDEVLPDRQRRVLAEVFLPAAEDALRAEGAVGGDDGMVLQ